MKGNGFKRRRRCPGMKRVLGWSKITFRCHDATNARGRERETIRKALTTNILKYIELKVRMHENA